MRAWSEMGVFQFALPRGERQLDVYMGATTFPVSIRAPAWGATVVVEQQHFVAGFQFALPRGERRR